MIQFKACRWKNFLSTGTEYIDLNLEKSPTTLIVGQNGSGKSTLLDALSFGLFGRAHRDINKNQLINSINKKKTVVEVEFEVGGTHLKYIVELSQQSLRYIRMVRLSIKHQMQESIRNFLNKIYLSLIINPSIKWLYWGVVLLFLLCSYQLGQDGTLLKIF